MLSRNHSNAPTGDNTVYKERLKWRTIGELQGTDIIDLRLQHFVSGPTISVTGQLFVPNDNEQTRLWGKTTEGWKFVSTDPMRLTSVHALSAYIQECIPLCIEETSDNGLLLRIFNVPGDV